jgi:LysM repeat protein
MKYGFYLFLFMTSTLTAVPLQHTIASGDTLYSLSQKYNIPVDLITKANNIQDAGALRIGQVLIVPGVHQVVAGDTIYSISRKYRVDQAELLKINGLNSPNALRIGSFLLVPAESQSGVSSNGSQYTQGRNSINSGSQIEVNRPVPTSIALRNQNLQGSAGDTGRFSPLVDYLDGINLSSDQYYLHLQGAKGNFWAPLSGKVVYIGRHRNLGQILLIRN